MKEFIIQNWRLIASLACIVVSIIIWIIRKPVASSLDSDIISDLSVLIAGWIKQVECEGNGETKKETVVSLSMKYLKKRYGRSLSDDEISLWTKRVSTLIELYLSTPQKKEVSNESKIKKS